MKRFFWMLLLFPFLANASFVATDLDVDFSFQPTPSGTEALGDPTAFFAFITPDGIDAATGLLVGSALAVPIELFPKSGQFKNTEFQAPFAVSGTATFDVGIWYDNEWSNPDTITYTGGDTYIFEWAPDDWGNQTARLLMSDIAPAPSAVPVPAAAWLFGSGLLGLVGVGRVRSI